MLRVQEVQVEGWLWGLAGIGLLVAVMALRRSAELAKELAQLKRGQHDVWTKVKQLGDDLKGTAEPLRLQMAMMAGGRAVPRELILSGRLYLSLSSLEAQRRIEEARGRAVLVDVSSQRDYAIKRIAGAKLLPLEELEQRYRSEIPEDAESVFVYCATGERSRLACDFLSRQGYGNLYHIRDGLKGWSGPTEGEGLLSLIQIQRKA
ncbi:MAG: rhodanese-like domain-containing protein [Nitrospiraceae bacterium]